MTLSPDFDAPALARTVEGLTEAEIDALPFGTIRLAEDGHVVMVSQAEVRLSGRGARPYLGLHFFADIAPCFAAPEFLGRIERAQAAGTIDIGFGIVGDFDDADKELEVRVQSCTGGGVWIFIRRG